MECGSERGQTDWVARRSELRLFYYFASDSCSSARLPSLTTTERARERECEQVGEIIELLDTRVIEREN